MTRCLYRPGQEQPQPGNGAPRGQNKSVIEARNKLGDYLDSALTRPLYFSDSQNAERVETALNTMTVTERVFLEIEMQGAAKVMHSYKYEAL